MPIVKKREIEKKNISESVEIISSEGQSIEAVEEAVKEKTLENIQYTHGDEEFKLKQPVEYLIAKFIQYNNKGEAKAIEDYLDFLKAIRVAEIDSELKKEIFSEIHEIIADEMNHMERLAKLCTKISGIKPMED